MNTILRIQNLRATAAQWTSRNPVLAAGEFGVEIDTLKVKVGNGTTSWNSLAYLSGGSGGSGGNGGSNVQRIEQAISWSYTGGPDYFFDWSHNLGDKPQITILDADGEIVEVAVEHVDTNNLTLTANSAFTGGTIVAIY